MSLPLEKLPALVKYCAVPAIHDGSYATGRVVGQTEEGMDITVPLQPYEHWVDADGNILELVVTTNVCGAEAGDQNPGRARGGFDHPDFNDRYYKTITTERRAKKWFPYHEYFEAHGPEKLLEEINRRRELVRRRSQKYTDMAATPSDLLREAFEGNRQSLDKILTAMAKQESREERKQVRSERDR